MTPEERNAAFLDLFIQPGWRCLIEDMREAYELLVSSAYLLPDEKALYRRKGEIQKLGELLAFEELTKLQLSENEADDYETL